MADTIGLMGVPYLPWGGRTFVGRGVYILELVSRKVSHPGENRCGGALRF